MRKSVAATTVRRVTVKIPRGGKNATFELEPDETLLSMKQKIEEETGIPHRRQRLVFAGEEIFDPDRTIADAGIHSGDNVYLVQRPLSPDAFVNEHLDGIRNVEVQNLMTSTSEWYGVRGLDSVLTLKRKIETRTGVSVDAQHLVMGKTELGNNARTLDSYDVTNRCKIHLVLRLATMCGLLS